MRLPTLLAAALLTVSFLIPLQVLAQTPGSAAGQYASGTAIALRDPAELWLLDTWSAQLRPPIPLPGEPSALAVSPDGLHAYVATPGGIAVVSVAAGEVTSTLDAGGEVQALALTPGGGKLLAYWDEEMDPQEGGRLVVLDTATGRTEGTVTLRGLGRDLAVSADGRWAVVPHRFYSGIVSIVDLRRMELAGEVDLEDGASAVAAGPGESFTIASGNNFGGRLSLIDPASRSVVREIELGADALDVALSADGTQAWAPLFSEGKVAAVDLAAGTVTEPTTVGDYPTRLALAPSGETALVLHNESPELHLVDVARGGNTDVKLPGIPAAVAIPAPGAPAPSPGGSAAANQAYGIIGVLVAAAIGLIGLLVIVIFILVRSARSTPPAV
jgi:DNA-binding beta-propeller fold protein YncE